MIVAPERPTVRQPLAPPMPVQIAKTWASPSTVSKTNDSSGRCGRTVDRIGVHADLGCSTVSVVILAATFPGGSSAKGIGSRSPMGLSPFGCPTSSRWRSISASTASAARRIRTCNQGIQGPSRFHEAWTISSSGGRVLAVLKPLSTSIEQNTSAEAGRSLTGIIVGAHPASL